MTKSEIFNILKEQFIDSTPQMDNGNPWGRITIARDLSVFTYSKNPKLTQSCQWYLAVYFDGYQREIEIPDNSTVEFIQEFAEVYHDISKVKELLESVNSRIDKLNNLSNIRQRKLKNVLGD